LWSRRWAVLMASLILASPIGILLVWDYGDAWGEWGAVGDWVPSTYLNAPLQDYNLPGWDGQLMASLGYVLSAVVGILAVVLLSYGLSLLVARKDMQEPEK